jgi:uncharacterized protein GlcG (DUF336 family)
MGAFEELKRFTDICEDVASEANIAICVTVLDAHGHPVLLRRMPGAGLLNLEMAERKAYTSAAMGCESGSLMERIQPGQPDYTLTSSSSRLIAFGGGTNVRFGFEVFGVGISGGPTAVEDMEILAAAQDRFDSPDAVWAERTFQRSQA